MWKNIYCLVSATLLLLMLAACESEVGVNHEDDRGTIVFECERLVAGPVETSTRIYKNKWEQRDMIGVFMHKNGDDADQFIYPNSRYITEIRNASASTEFRYANEGSKIYFPMDGAEYSFKAYYPYDKDLSANGYDIAIDVSNQSDRGNADLVVAQSDYFTDQTVSYPIHLDFENVMAHIEIILKAGVGVTDEEINSGVFNLFVEPIPTVGSYNFITNVLTNTPTTEEVQLLYNPQLGGYSDFYDAKVFPMSDISAVKIKVYHGSSYVGEVPLANANISSFDRATEYFYQLTINSLSVEMSSSIAWKNGIEVDLPIDYVNPLKMQFTYIPGGKFYMGSPTYEIGRNTDEQQHHVEVSSFFMGKYEVTNGQFAAFLNAKGATAKKMGGETYEAHLDLSYIDPNYGEKPLVITSNQVSIEDFGIGWDVAGQKWICNGDENGPCILVHWWGALAFADWIGARLLTEAEWEYACRGAYVNKGTSMDTFPWYTRTEPTTSDACIGSTSTVPVGSFPPNTYGLYNMIGNVYEWCSDWYEENYGLNPMEISSLVVNPQGPNLGNDKVIKGGFFRTSDSQKMRSANRLKTFYPTSGVGFRVGKDVVN